MGGSSSRTVTETDQTTNNEYNTIGQEFNGDNGLGVVGDGNDVVYQLMDTDYGAIDAAERITAGATDAVINSNNNMGDLAAEAVRSAGDTAAAVTDDMQATTSDALMFGRDAVASNEAVTADALNFGRDSLMFGENALSEAMGFGRDAMFEVSAMASASTAAAENMTGDMKSLAEYTTDSAINAALTGAGLGRDVAQEALLSNSDTTREALQTNEMLASNFGQTLAGFAADNQAISEAQASQYAQNLLSMSQQNADSNDTALMYQSDTADRAMTGVENIAANSLDNYNEQAVVMAQTLGDNSNVTQQALLKLAERQERGLDSALQVAGSVAMSDDAEAATNQTKYLALAMAVGAVAFALRG